MLPNHKRVFRFRCVQAAVDKHMRDLQGEQVPVFPSSQNYVLDVDDNLSAGDMDHLFGQNANVDNMQLVNTRT